MKKILLSASVIMMLASCGKPSVSHQLTNHKLGVTGDIELEIVEIEGCEYFFYQGTSIALTHKGNCSNRIHQYNYWK